MPDQHIKRRKGQQSKACFDDQELSASWYVQARLSLLVGTYRRQHNSRHGIAASASEVGHTAAPS